MEIDDIDHIRWTTEFSDTNKLVRFKSYIVEIDVVQLYAQIASLVNNQRLLPKIPRNSSPSPSSKMLHFPPTTPVALYAFRSIAPIRHNKGL
ncbi:hypothetical protein AYI68_g5180 [Smittium mucronatum]|uniref:Uncharacterized protein n=1 Tax=Smittium mucronatum TaxID=133383 RepID=A0A1R0GUY8_9FUNG|nr:hypothetical protein AYI68_g5180 [Smittium mucronatum]